MRQAENGKKGITAFPNGHLAFTTKIAPSFFFIRHLLQGRNEGGLGCRSLFIQSEDPETSKRSLSFRRHQVPFLASLRQGICTSVSKNTDTMVNEKGEVEKGQLDAKKKLSTAKTRDILSADVLI